LLQEGNDSFTREMMPSGGKWFLQEGNDAFRREMVPSGGK
jgi:hypothetical protein